MSNETRQAVNELANSVLPASITPQSLGNVLTQIVDEVERKADNTDANVLTSIAYDDLVYDNPFFAMIPTGNANVELFICGYSLTGCTLSWDRTTNYITFTITGPLTIKADGELDIIVGIENPAQKGTYLYSRNTVLCTKNTNNEYNTPWIYKVDTYLFSTAVEYVDQKLGSITKFKTGDVVYRTNVPKFHFGVMSWEEYVKNPTNSMDTKVPIGLVVDPVKRTFLFCGLLSEYFCTSADIETYFDGYTSFEDGSETFERISNLKATSKAADIPAFYALRNKYWGSETLFYVKDEVSYVPALKEWRMAKEHLCTAFYGDDDSYAGFMDRLIALRNGITPSSSLFIGNNAVGVSKHFYSQISTVGKKASGDNGVFNMNGEIPDWDNATDTYACCPVFGIYTEEEENA